MVQRNDGAVRKPGIRDVHETRLVVLFEQLLEDRKPGGTAKVLGVSRSTIYRAMEQNRLAPKIRQQLELYLLDNNGNPGGILDAEPAKTETVESIRQEFQNEIGRLEQELERTRQELNDREGQDRLLRQGALETQVQAIADTPPPQAEPEPAAARPATMTLPAMPPILPTAAALAPTPPAPSPTARASARYSHRYPTVVTDEPGAEGSGMYGAAASLVEEWREIRRLLGLAVTKVDLAITERRKLELEIRLIEEYGLTLPDAQRPYEERERRQELQLRRRGLERVDKEVRQAESHQQLRKILSLGFWKPPEPIWKPPSDAQIS